jgi:(2Fe-2S) ferredoxin
MPPFERHLFICLNQRPSDHPRGCCAAKGSEKIKALFKEEIKKRGLKGKIRANAAGCLDACEHGPTVVVYPEGVWYHVENAEDIREICDEHLEKGNVVQRLAIYPPNP